VEHPLVHHYSCAFQGPQPLFETADGYICPKCRKQLRHYGVDYDKPGSVISCVDCNATLSEPELGFICLDCNFYTSGDQATHRDWYHYDLLPDGMAALRAGELPHANGLWRHLRSYSVRDFRVLCERLVAVARQHERPLSLCRITLDSASLIERAGQRGFMQICSFVRDLIAENLRQGDAFSFLPNGAFVCCLPETDRRSAEADCRRLRQVIANNLSVQVHTAADVIARDDAVAFLRGLSNVR
jgi:GGDEF domain-containing protein